MIPIVYNTQISNHCMQHCSFMDMFFFPDSSLTVIYIPALKDYLEISQYPMLPLDTKKHVELKMEQEAWARSTTQDLWNETLKVFIKFLY